MPLRFTKNQTLILEIFFRDPEKSYYLRQLAKIIGKEPGVFQRDINKLVENGILASEFQANARFFKLNKNHPLYKEFKSIFLKTVGAEGKLKEILANIKNIQIAFIFGSFAKGREDSFSDIDLMIIGNPKENELIPKISGLEGKLDREINYNIFSSRDFRKNLKEKEIFLEEIMEGRKIFLVGDQNELERIAQKS
jgi:predicted nucleotidyltransferase